MRKGHHRHSARPNAPAAPVVEVPPRVRAGPMPRELCPPQPGQWLWTCRASFEAQLFEELAWARAAPALLGGALVASRSRPAERPTFARMAFPVSRLASSPEEALEGLSAEPTLVQVWGPDTDAGNTLSGRATAWRERVTGLRQERGLVDPATAWKAWEAGAWLGQICLMARGLAAVGQVRAREALSLAPGGRMRMKRTGEAPSRAAMKLDEALESYGVGPGRGEQCVDLGSAPGGWTRRLVERGATVWSVDPARLAPDLLQHPRVRHVEMSAFDFVPEGLVDWLFCDMAWRPLEVAQLLGKWARRRWAMHLVSNIKLPMKDKLPMVVAVRGVLEAAGWRHLSTRQLYHDRDEITVTARLM